MHGREESKKTLPLSINELEHAKCLAFYWHGVFCDFNIDIILF